LRQESFDRGFEGVAAWRQSPVYQIYTEIGVESIMSGKSIEQVIIDRQVKNLPVLTLSEFEAIIKLNKELVV